MKPKWIEIYKEIAKKLLKYENKQDELIQILRNLEEKNIPVIKLRDLSTKDKEIDLDQIDPFTFMANFNRQTKEENKIKILQHLKDIWKLNSEVPEHFEGIPAYFNMASWFFEYKYKREREDIKLLWDIFKEAVTKEFVSERLFNRCYQMKQVGTKLTRGLFMIDPEKYLALDSNMRKHLNIDDRHLTYIEYKELIDKVNTEYNIPFYELSRDAWIYTKNQKTNKKVINYWLFQGNPKVYDFESALREISINNWNVSSHLKEIKAGDRVIVWLTGKNAGCYALAEITHEAVNMKDDPDKNYWKEDDKYEMRVGIRITHNLVENPILKKEIKNIPELINLNAGNQGANFSATKEEYEAIVKLISKLKNEEKREIIDPIFNNTKNVIFYGPPGTGKTYMVNNIQNKWKQINGDDSVRFITFHQSYSYEEFIEGIKPALEEGNVEYELTDGIFKELVNTATENYMSSTQTKGSVFDKDKLVNDYFEYVNNELEKGEYVLWSNVIIQKVTVDSQGEYKSVVLGGSVKSEQRLTKKIILRDIEDYIDGKISNAYDIRPSRESNQKRHGNALYYYELYKKIGEYYKKNAKSYQIDNIKIKNYLLIIDEINRGNISKIFGELITLIEEDKRTDAEHEIKLRLPYSKELFSVPSNVYILGTMNTADRSIALMDIALRRRFEFHEIMPDFDLLRECKGDKLEETIRIMEEVNRRTAVILDRDHQLGHSFIFKCIQGGVFNKSRFEVIFEKEIIPTLREYFYEDWERLRAILGPIIIYRDIDSLKGLSKYARNTYNYTIKKGIRLDDIIKSILETKIENENED